MILYEELDWLFTDIFVYHKTSNTEYFTKSFFPKVMGEEGFLKAILKSQKKVLMLQLEQLSGPEQVPPRAILQFKEPFEVISFEQNNYEKKV